MMKEITLTAIFEPAEEGGFIGYIAELPGANTQGETLEECRENLAEAVEMILDANRDLANQKLATHSNVTREQVTLRVA